jgi:hypothetical protein
MGYFDDLENGVDDFKEKVKDMYDEAKTDAERENIISAANSRYERLKEASWLDPKDQKRLSEQLASEVSECRGLDI